MRKSTLVQFREKFIFLKREIIYHHTSSPLRDLRQRDPGYIFALFYTFVNRSGDRDVNEIRSFETKTKTKKIGLETSGDVWRPGPRPVLRNRPYVWLSV